MSSQIELGNCEVSCALSRLGDKQRASVRGTTEFYEKLFLLPRRFAEFTAKLLAKTFARSPLQFKTSNTVARVTKVNTDRGTEFTATGDVFPDNACDAYWPSRRGGDVNQLDQLRAD